MSWFSKKEKKTSIPWVELTTIEQLEQIKKDSEQKAIGIFKHSTRCSISTMAKSRLEREWDLDNEKITMYYLDLLQYRNISNAIESTFGVTHQSPQLILIQNQEAVYVTSHSAISAQELKNKL